MVEILGETSPLSPEHLRGNMQALEGRYGHLKNLHEELSPAEADQMRTQLRQVAPQLIAEAERHAAGLSMSELADIQRSHASGATFALRDLAKSKYGSRPLGLSPKRWWHQFGARLWPHTYAHTQDDTEVLSRWLPAFHRQEPSEREELTRLWFSTEEGLMLGLGVARWADQAYPLVQLAGHRYAAALMSTRPPQDADIRPPWKSFVIELPQGMLETDDQNGVMRPLTHVLVFTFPMYLKAEDYGHPERMVMSWSFMATGPHGVDLHRWRKTFDSLLDEGDYEGEDPFPSALAMDLSDRDARTMQLLTRLVVNTCLVMSDPEAVRPIGGSSKARRAKSKRGAAEPIFRTFRVGKPIKLDCRPAVQAYLNGERNRELSVQFLVRGHWRNQACGPRLTERRLTWIEPYWKGPEDAPINRRAHIVGTETS